MEGNFCTCYNMDKSWWYYHHYWLSEIKVKVSHSVVSDSLWSPGLYSSPGSFVHGILQARILEWVACPFSRGSSLPRDQTCISCVGRWVLYLGNPRDGGAWWAAVYVVAQSRTRLKWHSSSSSSSSRDIFVCHSLRMLLASSEVEALGSAKLPTQHSSLPE